MSGFRPLRACYPLLALAALAGLVAPAPVEAAKDLQSLARTRAFVPDRAPQAVAQCQTMFRDLKAQETGLKVAQTASTTDAEAALVAELSDMLQACSYDGSAIQVAAKSLMGASSSDGAAVVRTIMRFTGLPQNFKVMEGPVPNAAALIVMGPDKLPLRVIAYNTEFLAKVRQATENNDWASISIMAHEIGHHLSGHTLMPGGSQPPIELEADKFSGFVLYKMGATLGDAQKAISTLVPEEDGATHPGRAKRLAAIYHGWTESCEQHGGACEGGLSTTPAKAKTPAQVSAPVSAANGGAAPPPVVVAEDAPADAPLPVVAVADHLPKPDDAATPAKFDRFVYDETGLLHPAIKEQISRQAFEAARDYDVEVVTIITSSLNGQSANDYAYQMMRQLRVGKMEVGNGAVFVVALEDRKTGVALGPGLLVYYGDLIDQFHNYLESFLSIKAAGGKGENVDMLVSLATDRVVRDAQHWDWAVRFQSLTEIQNVAEADSKARDASGAAYDPAKDPTAHKLLRATARIVTQSPRKDDKVLYVSEVSEQMVGPAIHMQTTEGKDIMVYASPSVVRLMSGPIEDNKTYSVVLRNEMLDLDTPQFSLISYDLVAGQ